MTGYGEFSCKIDAGTTIADTETLQLVIGAGRYACAPGGAPCILVSDATTTPTIASIALEEFPDSFSISLVDTALSIADESINCIYRGVQASNPYHLDQIDGSFKIVCEFDGGLPGGSAPAVPELILYGSGYEYTADSNG